jgi:hypothetical protein
MKKQEKISLLLTGLVLSASLSAQVKIQPGFFGGNWWLSDYRGAPFGSNPSPSPPEAGAVSLFTTTGAITMRSGGIALTVNTSTTGDNRAYPIRTDAQGQVVPNPAGYVKLVDDIRAKGFEPHLTVPFDDRSKTRSIEEQALEAADIVRTVNKVHKRNVKYWIIANEPEQSQDYFGEDKNGPTQYQVEQVRRYTGFLQCT